MIKIVGSAFGSNNIFSRDLHPGEAEYIENFHNLHRDIYDVKVGDKVRGKSNCRIQTGVVLEVKGDIVLIDSGKETDWIELDKLILII